VLVLKGFVAVTQEFIAIRWRKNRGYWIDEVE